MYSPGFNCKSAKLSNVESMICNSPDLSQKDYRLNQLYEMASKKADKYQIKKGQRNWIKNIRNKCTTLGCLTKVYENREIYLGNISVKDGKFNIKLETNGMQYTHYLWRTNDSTELLQIKEFDHFSRNRKTANVISCDTVWENHTGRINYGYGGICRAEINGKLSNYFICTNEVSSNYFQISTPSEYLLVRFIENNCYGG